RVAAAKRAIWERHGTDMSHHVAPERGQGEDLLPLLDQELSRLPEKFRVVIVLCDLEERPRKEVAARLKIPEGTLSSRLTNARRLLGKRLSRRGVTVVSAALAAMLPRNALSASVPVGLVVA